MKYLRGEMVTIIATHSAGGYLSALVRTEGNDAGHWINIWSAFNREHIIRRHGISSATLGRTVRSATREARA